MLLVKDQAELICISQFILFGLERSSGYLQKQLVIPKSAYINWGHPDLVLHTLFKKHDVWSTCPGDLVYAKYNQSNLQLSGFMANIVNGWNIQGAIDPIGGVKHVV